MRRCWILGCAALLTSGPLLAGDASPDARFHRMAEVDTDKDGFVTLAEAQANAPRLAEKFQDLDVDKDGQLSKDELKSSHATTHRARKMKLDETFQKADADGDSRLSRSEAEGVPFVSERFADLDKDGDGFVTKEEIGKIRRMHRRHDGHADDQQEKAEKPAETT